MKSGLWIWIGLVLVVAGGTAARWYAAYHLYNPALNTKRQFSGDEMVYIRLADRLVKEGRYDARGIVESAGRKDLTVHAYMEAPLYKHPPLFPLFVGIARKMFWGVYGCSIYPSLLMGAAGIAGVFWLARETGIAPAGALLAAALLALSPTHWICSSRIWLDSTLTGWILLGCAAELRALDKPRWHLAGGLFWGLAFLTKYTAFAGWAFLTAAALLRPQTRRCRFFWLGQAVAAGLFLPWMIWRLKVEGAPALLFWQNPGEDWRTLSRLWKWLWVLPLAAALGWAWWKLSRREDFGKLAASPKLLFGGTFAFVLLGLTGAIDLGALPWFGYGPNQLAHSSRDFFLSRQIIFEPAAWWGFIGLAVWPNDARANLMRAGWLGFFLFLTVWGNFQMRYGLPLIPFEEVLAAGMLGGWLAQGRKNIAAASLAVVWMILSAARSVWIMVEAGIDNQYFYF